MAELGGFFAVSYLAETVVRKALDDAWKVRWKDARGALSYTVPTPVGQLVAAGAFSLEKPVLAFVGAANAVRLHLKLAVRLDLQLDGGRVGGVFLEASPTIEVPIVVEQDSAINKGSADLSGFTIDAPQLRLTWYDIAPDARSSTAVLSDASRARLTDELRRRAKPFLTFTLPTDRVFMAQLAMITAGGPNTVIIPPFSKLGGARVLDGWLAVGVDDTSQTPTQGNPLLIGPPPALPPGTASIHDNAAIIVDSGMLQTYLQLNANLAVRIGLASRPNIHPTGNPSVAVHDDLIEITSIGQVDAPDPFPGTAGYSAIIKVRPYIADGSKWMYASVSPNIRVDAPWYMDVIGGLMEFFGVDVYAKLRRANQGSMASLFQASAAMDVPEMPGLRAGITGRKVVLRPDVAGIFGTASTGTWAAEPPIDPKLLVEPSGSVKIRERYLRLGLSEYWATLLRADPTYRLRYTVRRRSDGAPVLTGAGWSGAATFSEALDLWDPVVYLETGYQSEVILERPPGNEISRRTDSIAVQDLFDRSHPYARWRHPIWWFDQENPPERHTEVRRSAIHKTAIAERCQFSDAGTAQPYRYTVQALDTLPPPSDPEYRDRLCPYCFGSV
jgi:hypothetical protein